MISHTSNYALLHRPSHACETTWGRSTASTRNNRKMYSSAILGAEEGLTHKTTFGLTSSHFGFYSNIQFPHTQSL